MRSRYFLFLLLAHTSLASSAMPEIMVVEGNNVTLNCSAEEGEIQWYKDGELLMNNSQTAIYTDILENSSSSTSFLELNSVEGRNTGSYSCQIVNEAGNFSVAEFGIQVDLVMRLFSFSQPSYNGSEDDGYVSVCMELIDGTLTENVIIVLESTASYTNGDSYVLPILTYFVNGTQPSSGPMDSQICANISIIDDNIAEGTKKLTVCASSEQDYVIVIETNCTDIYIEDNDLARFQFSQQTYNTTEDEKVVHVCLDFVNYAVKMTGNTTFMLRYYNNNTKSKKFGLPTLMHRANDRQACANIPIANDTLVEGTEKFSIQAFTNQNHVVIDDDRATAEIYIMDSDFAKFKFLNDTYNVKEDSGNVKVCLELVDGTIEGVIIGLLVNSSLSNLTNEELVICDNQTVQGQQICFDIAIIDDHLVESAKTAVICGCSPHNVTFNGCITLTIEDNDRTLDEKLKSIATNLTSGMVETALSKISQFVQESEGNMVDQTDLNLNTIFKALSNISDFILKEQEPITETAVANMTQTLNSLLQWIPAAFESPNTSSRIVEIFEDLVSRYAQQICENEPPQVFNFTLLTIATERSSKSNLASSGRRFSNSGGLEESRQEDSGTALYPNETAAITLPPSLFKRVNDSNISIFFGFYETAALFPINITSSTTRQTLVTSPVIAATVVPSLEDLTDTENITITFRLPNNTDMFMASGSVQCVSWNFSSTMWLPEGCTTNTSNIQNQIVSCHCNHLTNFAITADVCTVEQDCLNTTEKLEQLNSTFNNLTAENYEIAVFNLSQIVKESESMLEQQNGEVLDNIANYFELLQDFLNGINGSNINISIDVVNNTTQVISSLLQWQPSNINTSASVAKTSRILQSFELVLSRFAQQLAPNENETIILPALTVALESISIENLSIYGRSFVIGDISEPMLGSDVQPDDVSPEQDAINLPPALFKNEMISGYDNIGLLFTLYNSSTLFPVNAGKNLSSDQSIETVVGSRIIAATVGANLTLRNLEEQESVTIVLQLLNPEKNYTKMECVSWDFVDNNWMSEGCATNESQSGTVICSCNHLTNFAVLVDICLRQEDCEISDDNHGDESLTIISYVGISISIICLVLTIISLLTFKIVRQKDISKYHIQLSLALLLMLTAALILVAFSSARKVPIYVGCVMISIFVHYFTLVAVMWMGAEALLMFQKLVTVFYQITTKYIVAVSIVCWTIPLIPVVIPLIVDTAMGHDIEGDIIVMRNNTEGKIPYCFLSHPGAFFGAFLVPILAVMVFNTFLFIWIIAVLVRHSRNKAALQKEDISIKSLLRRMVSIGGIMSLFGLTWLFAVFTFLPINELKKMFDSFFVIFNSFQGLFIFFSYIVLNKEIRESWKELLLCGRYQSKHPPHSQPKITPKLRNSGSSGSTLPTGVKGTSEPSKSDLDTMMHKTAESESDVIKNPPPLESISLDPDFEAIELDKLSIKTAMSTEATVTMEETNEAKEPHETAMSIKATVTMEETNETKESHEEITISDESKYEDEDMLSKMCIKQYTTQREFKHQVEQVEVDFYDDDSDKEESTKQI